MAAAWDFPSFHSLRNAITAAETSIGEIPERYDVQPDLMMDRCASLGIRLETARSLALTMFLVQDGEYAVEMMEDYEELHGARALSLRQDDSGVAGCCHEGHGDPG